jgi:succinoglycan biosynthesis transport protein ExoP
MLQTSKTRPLPLVDDEAPTSEFVTPAEILDSFLRFVRRQFWLVLFVTALMVALGIVYVVTTPPTFTAKATMIVDTRKPQLFQQQSVYSDAVIDSAMVASEVEILKSENVALAVIKKLRLTEDLEFVGPSNGLFPAIIGFVTNRFGKTIDSPRLEFERTQQAVAYFQSHLRIAREGLTYVMDVTFRSRNPDRSAQVANAVVDAYIDDQLESKYEVTRRASAWLQQRIGELRDQVSVAERAAVEFKTKNNIVNISSGPDGRLMDEQQVEELNRQLATARAHTSDARARLDRIEAVLRADSPTATVDATVADTLGNSVITQLRSKYLDFAQHEADWSQKYGHGHLAAVNARNQMQEIRNSILDELRRIAESYKSDYEIATQREQGIQKELNQAVSQKQVTSQAQVQLRELESNARTSRTLYDNLLQHYMESVQQQSFPTSEARLITAATRPSEKSDPKTKLILAVVGMGGLILGLGIGWLRTLLDRVFRTREQVEAALEKQCVAMLPLMTRRAVSRPVENPIGRIISRNTLWSVVYSPFSRFTESIRSIKVAIDANRAMGKVIGVTSTLPNEGKSTIAASVAQVASHAGARVILVDSDLRNSTLSRTLAPGAEAGILDVISGKVILEDAVWTDATTNLTFLPGNVKGRLAHSSEILASGAIKKLFEHLSQRFDYVIVDLSPLAPLVDVRAAAHFVDYYLLVVEWGRTKKHIVERALNEARVVYENILGIVLNKTDFKALARYEGYGGYHYSKDYSRYGYTD